MKEGREEGHEMQRNEMNKHELMNELYKYEILNACMHACMHECLE